MATKFETDSRNVGTGWNWIQTRKGSSDQPYLEGVVMAPEGIVDVYSERLITSMRFMWGGRLYTRTWKKGFASQGLSRLAKAFAKEIASRTM